MKLPSIGSVRPRATRPRVSLAAACALAVFLSLPVAAQETPPDLTKLSLEELMTIEVDTVYGASKFAQKVTEAPASVTIITADEIRKYGYRTLADIVRSVPGFYVFYDRSYSHVGLRGFAESGSNNPRILLLIDGHRVNDNIFDEAHIGTDAIDVDLIDRVEFIRGPGSSLYGSNAFLGVINILTKRGRNLKGAEVSTSAASLDTYQGRLSYGEQFSNGVEMLLSGTMYDSHGNRKLYYPEFDSPQTNHGIAENADGDRFQDVLADIAFRGFRLQGFYHSSEKQVPTALYSVFNDPRVQTADSRNYFDLKYEHTFRDSWSVLARVFSDRSETHQTYVLDLSDQGIPPFGIVRFLAHGEWWGLESAVSKTIARKHHLTLETEYRDNLQQDQKVYIENPYFLHTDDHRSTKNWAVYVQDEFRIRKDLTLSAGLRYDHYSTFGGTVNPRLGLIYSPWEKTAFKILYGQAFRAPSPFELYLSLTPTPPRVLRPEEIKSTELIFERYQGKHLRLSAGGFYDQVHNLIAYQVFPELATVQFTNVEQAHGKGLQGELEGKWSNGVSGRISYTIQETYNDRTGQFLSNSPRHLAKANLILPLAKKKLFAGLEGQFVSGRGTEQNTVVGSYFVTNITLFGQKLWKGLDVSASAYNLTVGESDEFVRHGGMIGFCLEENKIRFDINLKAAQRGNLKISSRLLLLAKTVISDGRQG
jgi:iron complex outermembrane receptor protein